MQISTSNVPFVSQNNLQDIHKVSSMRLSYIILAVGFSPHFTTKSSRIKKKVIYKVAMSLVNPGKNLL